MSGDRSPLTEVKPHRSRWRTVPTSRTVLAVVHNVTAATRLFDVLPVVATDPRVQVVFTCPGSSAFTDGTVQYLQRHRAAVLPWRRALAMKPHLAIAASSGGELHRIRAPLMSIPHGMGYNKFLKIGKSENRKIGKSENRKIGKSVFGLSAPWLMHDGKLVPSVLVLSHEEQRARLATDCPMALNVALVAGDPSFDRMLASRPLRETYRQRFGIHQDQRLVLVSSTWGDRSLYGAAPDVFARMARQLPIDSYRTTVALHPNIEHGHSGYQIEQWCRSRTGDGLLVLPHEDLWRQAAIAADVVVGDHGSVTFYAAALGTPVLLAVRPTDTVDPRSPIAALLAALPALEPGDDLAAALERAIGEHDPGRLSSITELTTSYPGQAAERLAEAMYRLLELRRPGPTSAGPVLPLPEDQLPTPSALSVSVELTDESDSATLEARLHRVPTGPLRVGETPPGHLVVDVDSPSSTALALAEIVVHRTAADPARWVTETLRALPGALLATARDGVGWLVGGPGGWLVRIDTDRSHHNEGTNGSVFASVLHEWLCRGHPVDELPKTLVAQLGPIRLRAETRLIRADQSVPGRPSAKL